MATTEIVIATVIGLLLGPYLMYGWLYGLTLVKKLYDKEWKEKKGLLGAYERLTPEERMNLDLQRTRTQPPKEEPAKQDTAWLGNPTPREENIERNEKVYKEGLVTTPAEGRWETPQDVEPTKPVQTSQPARVA